MNALTKAFVVVVTILSVVLVALVVPFAARVPDYASQFEQMKQDRDVQLAKATQTAADVRSEIAKAGTDLDAARATIAELTGELNQSNNENKTLLAKIDQLQVTVDRNAAALEVAARVNETQGGQINQQSDQIKQYLASVSELQQRTADLSQSLIESKSRERRLSDNYLRIQEELKAAEQQLLEKTAQLEAAMERLVTFTDIDPNKPLPTDPPVAILGSVTKIDQVKDGLTFVQVNVGTRDLVEEGMEFTVYRGDEFVGKIQIASVDTADSVGQLTLGGGVQEGDKVRAGGR